MNDFIVSAGRQSLPSISFAKKKIPKIQDYYGSGWVGPGLTRNLFLENHPETALNQYRHF